MDVPHATGGHHKKKWKEYLLEFCMIFLAVTLSFFAENTREHYVEGQREKEYARSLYNDLRIDTFTIRRTLQEKRWAGQKIDSLQQILEQNTVAQHNELLYYYERVLFLFDVFTAQDVTYKQLVSSGNFRYFKKVDLYKRLSDYYNLYSRYEAMALAGSAGIDDFYTLEAQWFNAGDMRSLYATNPHNFYEVLHRPTRRFAPVRLSAYHRNLLILKAEQMQSANRASIFFLEALQGNATALLQELKAEYHLK
ncbi:hypothetical protein [Hymenobacter sp. BT730]|uniref:hypothetical protein n=1 Tax=Hymenobacter sp. BT730 TaxID=3063332 RepID=UPI0026DFE0EE|nr:hypothetical protein [Hymenobacter sp. BT730]